MRSFKILIYWYNECGTEWKLDWNTNNPSVLNRGRIQREYTSQGKWWNHTESPNTPSSPGVFKACTSLNYKLLWFWKEKFFSYLQLASLLTRWNEQTHIFPNLKFLPTIYIRHILKDKLPTFMLLTNDIHDTSLKISFRHSCLLRTIYTKHL